MPPGKSSDTDTTRLARARRRCRPTFESLEGRALLTGNLAITGAHLVDVADQPIAAPVIGEQVFVDAQWTSTGLSTSDSYTVAFSVDGVVLDSSTIQGKTGDNLPFHWYIGGWFASPGAHNVKVTVDPKHAVAETSYSDNTTSFSFTPVPPSTFPQKLTLPIAGVPFQSWSVVNYVDVNPLPSAATDYRGGGFTYDGHQGYDFVLPDFAHMDAGVPVFAAAAGTVTQVQDGHYDRQTAFSSAPANFVDVSLGNGWEAQYYHFMDHSITVQVGQTVKAGQLLGDVGSSGYSTAPHLHFDIRHNGDVVETFYDPGAYWVAPLPYQGNVSPTITDLGTTNADPGTTMEERPVSVTDFPTSADWPVWFWFDISYLNANDQLTVNWYRPDGSLATSDPYTASKFLDYERFKFYLSYPSSTWAENPGTWQVSVSLNGKELGRTSFDVTSGAGHSTIKVDQGNTYILDRRTTPIDLGKVAQGAAAPELAFTLDNVGSTTLTTSDPTIPTGFKLVGSFPSSIAPGASAAFTLAMSTAAVGPQFGQLTFQTNDPSASTFGFNVSGTITGSPLTGAPLITLSGAAMPVGLGEPPASLAPSATLTDSSTAGMAGGTLLVAMASGGTASDRLSIVNQGNNAGQIGFNGNTVDYGGTAIGSATSTSGPAALTVTLNANATVAAVQALLETLSYQNVGTKATTVPRYVRFEVIDGGGLASNLAVEMVVNSGERTSDSGTTPVPLPSPTPSPTGPPPPVAGSPPVLTSTPTSVNATPPPAPAPVGIVPTRRKHHARSRPTHRRHHAVRRRHRARHVHGRRIRDRRLGHHHARHTRSRSATLFAGGTSRRSPRHHAAARTAFRWARTPRRGTGSGP